MKPATQKTSPVAPRHPAARLVGMRGWGLKLFQARLSRVVSAAVNKAL